MPGNLLHRVEVEFDAGQAGQVIKIERMPRGIGQGPIVAHQFLGLELDQVGSDDHHAVDGVAVDELDPFAGACQAGIAHADHDLAAAGGNPHRLLDQLSIGAIGQQLHEPHRSGDQQAVDAGLPLLLQMGFESFNRERVVIAQWGKDRGDDERFLGCHFGHGGRLPLQCLN